MFNKDELIKLYMSQRDELVRGIRNVSSGESSSSIEYMELEKQINSVDIKISEIMMFIQPGYNE